ncbi:MAG: 3-isopropylmalate dehydrogenase [Deferribacterota bacterium]|nr:3-isopropylmalate dehydrogenase [Deferribacterota bacterium]
MYTIAILPGDGIGIEVTNEAVKVLKRIDEKFDIDFRFKYALIGGSAIDEAGVALPNETKEVCDKSDAILLGAVGGPKWENLPPEEQPERGGLLPLRKHFNLFINIRPIKVYNSLKDISPIKNRIIDKGVDFLIFRELTGGLYFSTPKYISDDRSFAIDTMKYTAKEIKRIAKVAFQAARLRNKRITSIDKANVLSTSLLWREIFINLQKNEFSDIELDHLYVDNAAMQIIRDPARFDIIVTENMFGDILSDESAVLCGSLGLLASASIGERSFGLYEPVHGSAPDIYGQNKANPIGAILSVALMLRYSFNRDDLAIKIEKAVEHVLNENYATLDIFVDKNKQKLVSTDKMGDLIINNIS